MRHRERRRGEERGYVSPQSHRQDVDQQEVCVCVVGGRGSPPGCWITGGSAQGLAGGRGEGQEPWLSKLAVLAFHCRTHKHEALNHLAKSVSQESTHMFKGNL